MEGNIAWHRRQAQARFVVAANERTGCVVPVAVAAAQLDSLPVTKYLPGSLLALWVSEC